VIVNLRKCNDCKIEKTLNEFHPNRSGYCKRCRSCENIRRRRLYKENENRRKRILEANRKSRETNGRYLDKRKVYDQKYIEKNKDKVRCSKRAWDRRNPEAVRMKVRNRRSKIRKLSGRCTPTQWMDRLAYYGGKCRYCGCSGKMTADHRVPISRGGTGFPSNLVPACLSCNSRKRDMTELEYIEFMSRRNAR
jgi:5-methylcytosine-specific restriction endonuclease McrA